jgi:hypothetical protein
MNEGQYNDINNGQHLSDEELKAYINHQLSAEQQHALEMEMDADPFAADAAEGLTGLDSKVINAHVSDLQFSLRKQIQKKKKKKRIQFNQSTVIITFVIVMLLAVLAYFVILQLGRG